jgi:hypothetical protein
MNLKGGRKKSSIALSKQMSSVGRKRTLSKKKTTMMKSESPDKVPESSIRVPPPAEFHFNSLRSARDHYMDYKIEVLESCKSKNGAIDIEFIKEMAKTESKAKNFSS